MGQEPTSNALILSRAAFIGGVALLTGCGEDYWFGAGNDVQAEVSTPHGLQFGKVPICYTLTGEESRAAVVVEYSTNGVTFRQASQSGGDSIDDLRVTSSGESYLFVWDSAADVDDASSEVILRVTPRSLDGFGGVSSRSEIVSVENSRVLAEITGARGGFLTTYRFDAVEGSRSYTLDPIKNGSLATSGSAPSDVIWHNDCFIVVHAGSDEISVFRGDREAGTVVLEAVTELERKDPGAGGLRLAAADGGFLFVLEHSTGTISTLVFRPESGFFAPLFVAALEEPGITSIAAGSGWVHGALTAEGEVVTFRIEESGELTRLWRLGGLDAPSSLVVSAGYLHITGNNSFSTFRVEDGGRLSATGNEFSMNDGAGTRMNAVGSWVLLHGNDESSSRWLATETCSSAPSKTAEAQSALLGGRFAVSD